MYLAAKWQLENCNILRFVFDLDTPKTSSTLVWPYTEHNLASSACNSWIIISVWPNSLDRSLFGGVFQGMWLKGLFDWLWCMGCVGKDCLTCKGRAGKFPWIRGFSSRSLLSDSGGYSCQNASNYIIYVDRRTCYVRFLFFSSLLAERKKLKNQQKPVYEKLYYKR